MYASQHTTCNENIHTQQVNDNDNNNKKSICIKSGLWETFLFCVFFAAVAAAAAATAVVAVIRYYS